MTYKSTGVIGLERPVCTCHLDDLEDLSFTKPCFPICKMTIITTFNSKGGCKIYLIRLLGCPSGVRHALKRSPTARSASMPARSRGSRPPPVWTAWRGFPPLALLYKASLGWMGLRRVSHLPFLLDEACSSSRGEASVVSSCTLSLAWQ